MTIPCDLHLHSDCSDGALPPKAVVALAAQAKLPIISLTDHDTVCGVKEATEAAVTAGIKCVAGIEFSAYGTTEVHILGYNVPYEDAAFCKEIDKLVVLRYRRNEEMITKLKSQGIKLDPKELFKGGVKGRQYIASLLHEQGFVRSKAEAFDKYIGANKPCFVKANRISVRDAVRLILDYGGVPVIAHPMRYAERLALEPYIGSLAAEGLKGIELYYPNQRAEDTRLLKAIAKRHKLIVTGGSDFHSVEYGAPIGGVKAFLDESALFELKLL